MVESRVLQSMVDYASLNFDDTVLEVGAGLGFLTHLLKEECKTVLAVEVDSGLARILREQLKVESNVRIIQGDVFKASVPSFNKVVSIPPYNISSRLLLWLFGRGFDRAVLILQREFANRLVAPVGSEDYGWLTVLAYCQAEVELLDAVPKSMFYPPPKIDSVMTLLKPKRPRLFVLRNESLFRRLLQSLFTQRNRKVRNAVLSYLRVAQGAPKESAEKIANSLPWRDKRVRELPPEDFGELANVIIK